MTQRIKPDRPIWPSAPSETRPAPVRPQTRPRGTEERGQQGQSVPTSTAESFGSFVG